MVDPAVDPLSLLRQYNINRREIIETDDRIIFGKISWPKKYKTNYIAKRFRGEDEQSKQYYTLECLLYFLKNIQVIHPVYCRLAAAANIQAVRRPDRSALKSYLYGTTATNASIDKDAPLDIPQIMDSIGDEVLERDQTALNNYQESRKRLRSINQQDCERLVPELSNACISVHQPLPAWSNTECVFGLKIIKNDILVITGASSSPLSDRDAVGIKKEKANNESTWKPTDSVWHNDPSGMYGLKPEYLRILGIEPPICNWVCVENFRCDKSELREVLELAGYVVVCSLIYSHQKHAKVMYSHPLEAVQAVSMLNKQKFYGRVLTVTMMRYPLDSVILPKALPNIGPGFGAYGKPLRNIVQHYERFVNKKPNSLNSLLFYDPNNPRDDEEMRAPGSEETIGNEERSKDEIYERFQFSKQFAIRHVEDDSDDSKSEKDSKNSSWGTDDQQNNAPKITIPSKYSSRSPTCSPLTTEVDRKNIGRPDGPTYSWDKAGTAVMPKRPAMGVTGGPNGSMGPVSGQNNSMLPTPMGQGAIGPNVAPGPVGSRFGPNPMAVPIYRPNVPMVGPNAPAVRPNVPMTNPNVPGPVAAGLRPNVPMTRPSVPMANPNIPGTLGPVLRPNAGPSSAPMLSASTSFAVQFRNLPPTTTFAILSDKMSQCGQVMSIQLTTPGCATVSFSHPTHAQRCFQRFNNLCVDGCVIQVRIV